ncbi:MAG TPA: hypothetical protein ENN58_03020 [bacterium]|nr:hypothetical protein [bacterium]
MKEKQIQIFNISFLFILLSITFGINFFHTEHNAQNNPNCPACHFQNSTIAIHQINFFHLPQLNSLKIINIIENHQFFSIFLIAKSSRSPPQI